MLNSIWTRTSCLLSAGSAIKETEAETETLLEEVYSDAKSAHKVWDMIFSSRFFYALILLALLPILYKVVDLAMRPFHRHHSKVFFSFVNAVIKAVITIVIVIRILNLFDLLNGVGSQILMSSSLLVVVLGFVFQEGLTNIVHGFILSVSGPFEIGDRVTVATSQVTLTGYVRSMGLRSTTIQNIETNALVTIPNSQMDLGVIYNSSMDTDGFSSGFLDLRITYESDLDKTLALVARCIAQNPYVEEEAERQQSTDPPMVVVLALGESGIDIRGIVRTNTAEENYIACSQIREAVKKAVDEDPQISFAYPHIHVVSTDCAEESR